MYILFDNNAVCAACIRENIGFQEKRGNAQCPTCRVACDARDLVPNLVLRGVVEKYHALVECVGRGDIEDDADKEVDIDDGIAPRAPRRNPPRASVIQNMTYGAVEHDDDDQAIDLVDEDDDFIPSQMHKVEGNRKKREDKKRKTIVQSNTEHRGKSSFVQCPICNEHVHNLVLNSHIDSCLAQPREKAANMKNQPSASTWQPLQVPPKLMGNLASEKSVRQALRKYSLPATEGRKADLIDRYNRFRMEVTLANDKQEQTTYEKIAWRVSKKEKRRAAASLLRMDMQATTTTTHKAVIDMTDHTDIDAYSHPREVQTQGYSFEELIRVTKLRDAVRKKMRAQQATHVLIVDEEAAVYHGHDSSC